MDKKYVKCIDAEPRAGLTLDKIYEGTGTQYNGTYCIEIINDYKERQSYFASRFEEVEHKLEIGDIVKVLRAGKKEEDDWTDQMDNTVGEEYKVENLRYGFGRHADLIGLSNGFWYNKDTLQIIKKGNDMENTAKNTMIESVQNREFIVGSVNEHGYVSISASPVRHSTEAKAKAEAKRLAGLDPLKTFIVLQFRAGFQATQVVEI